jgi:carboxymethylenebutenolidase
MIARRHLLLGLVGSLAVGMVQAEDLTAISYPRQNGQVEGFFLRPELSDGSGVLLVHDRAGISPDLKALAVQLMQAGYAVLIPNLLDHESTLLVQAVQQGFTVGLPEISDGQTLEYLDASVGYLEKQLRGDGIRTRIAVMGLGWGSGPALLYAAENNDLVGVVVYGARFPQPLERLGQIQAPILANFPEGEKNLPEAEALLTNSGKNYDFKVFTGTKAGFYDSRSLNYDQTAATLAWERTRNFLRTVFNIKS